mgnify:CR=1 FL=1
MRVSATSYPLSQNWPKDNTALFRMDGKMCAWRTAIGNVGKSSKAVCDDVMMAPSGCFTCIPFLQAIIFVQGDEVQI